MVINLSELNRCGAKERSRCRVGVVSATVASSAMAESQSACEAYGRVERTGLLRTPDTGLA